MTQQWQLSGNAESVDWSDLAMAGRAYADNLVGEPTISKVMHMMADEIERLRATVRPQPYAKSDEKCVFYDTKRDTTQPRNGALGEEVAWAVIVDGEQMYVSGCKEMCEYQAYYYGFAASVVPLYRHPQPTLTDEEREAVEAAVDFCESTDKPLPRSEQIATLRKLLERLHT